MTDQRRDIREMQPDEEAGKDAALMRAIDGSLKRTFGGVSGDDVERMLIAAQADAVSVVHRPRWRTPLAIAASVAMLIIGGWLIQAYIGGLLPGEAKPYGVVVSAGPAQSMADAYAAEVASGFAPAWVCETDDEFRGVFETQFGSGLLLTTLPEDIVATGIDYEHVLSRRTTMVLFEVGLERTPVMVVVDRVDADGQPLNATRRVVGDLVLYEIGPVAVESPGVLRYFYNPES